MGKTILSEVEGWTPLITAIVQECGLIEAAVYGRVWRYCQGERGVCQASTDTIADELGLSRMTIYRHLQKLVAAGYLDDLTPDLRNKPHTYQDTGRVIIAGIVSARVAGVSQRYSGVSESYSHCNRELHEERSKRQEKREEEPPENPPAAVAGKAPQRIAPELPLPANPTTTPPPAPPRPDPAWAALAATPRPAATPDPLAPDTPGTRALFSGRRMNGAAKHRRVAERFTSVQQRDMFLRAEQALAGAFDALLEKAFVKCGNDLAGLVLYLNGAAEKLKAAPAAPPAGTPPATSTLTAAQREKLAQRNSAPPGG